VTRIAPARRAGGLARLAASLAVAAGGASCRGAHEAPPAFPLAAPPVDSARAGPVEEVARWPLRETVVADLDADGRPDSVILASDVTLSPGGAPLWEDGHRWAVLVEDGGERTLLYAAFVPRGHAEAAIARPSADGTRSVVVHERTPERAVSFTIAYDGPRRARLVSSAYDHVERWLPPLHER
jgi:hypothetical protein